MKFPIKIVYDIDEQAYRVFVDGIKNIEGFGSTESEALDNFIYNYEKIIKE